MDKERILTEEIQVHYLDIKERLDAGKHITRDDMRAARMLLFKLCEDEKIKSKFKKYSKFQELRDSGDIDMYFYYEYFKQLERDFYVSKSVKLTKINKETTYTSIGGLILTIGSYFFANKYWVYLLIGFTFLDIYRRFVRPRFWFNKNEIVNEYSAEAKLEFIDKTLGGKGLDFIKRRID